MNQHMDDFPDQPRRKGDPPLLLGLDNASRKKQARFRVRFLGGSMTSVEKVKERQSEEHV
jgi:hypothetical protein